MVPSCLDPNRAAFVAAVRLVVVVAARLEIVVVVADGKTGLASWMNDVAAFDRSVAVADSTAVAPPESCEVLGVADSSVVQVMT